MGHFDPIRRSMWFKFPAVLVLSKHTQLLNYTKVKSGAEDFLYLTNICL